MDQRRASPRPGALLPDAVLKDAQPQPRNHQARRKDWQDALGSRDEVLAKKPLILVMATNPEPGNSVFLQNTQRPVSHGYPD